MKKVCVIGHFGFGENMLNGQTIKTKSVTNALEKQIGVDQVIKIDTHGGIKALPKIIIQMFKAFKKCKNIIIFPAHNGIKVFVPLCNIINIIFQRKLHYVVIGGWLPSFLSKRKRLKNNLTKFSGIYVETNTMKTSLNQIGLFNVIILRNFKDINVISSEELYVNREKTLRICTFSRVMKEKGIEDIINAIVEINEKYNDVIYSLDIYGQIDNEQVKWFDELKKSFPSYVSYKGMVQYDKSVDVLKDYFMLVFPTLFYTEGIPGTILDAYAAGIPVLASRWESFQDVIDEGATGIGYEFANIRDLTECLEKICNNPRLILDMKEACIKKAEQYLPQAALINLLEKLL